MRARVCASALSRKRPRTATAAAVVVVVVVDDGWRTPRGGRWTVVVSYAAAYRNDEPIHTHARARAHVYGRRWWFGVGNGVRVRGMNIILGSYSHFRTLYACVCVCRSQICTRTHTLARFSPLRSNVYVYTSMCVCVCACAYGVCVWDRGWGQQVYGNPPRPPGSTSGRRQRVAPLPKRTAYIHV